MSLSFALTFIISFLIHFLFEFVSFFLTSYAFEDIKLPQSIALVASYKSKCHIFIIIQLKYIVIYVVISSFTMSYLEVHCLFFKHLEIF